MTTPGTPRVLVGYDGSPSAVTALEAAARLVPSAAATVVHLWEPPFTSHQLRQRLADRAADLEELGALLEEEGRAAAERLAGNGVALARASGWTAEPLVLRSYGGDGYQFARAAEERDADLVVVGSRGLTGVKALMGSVSELVVHLSPVPVLVVPDPLTTAEWAAVTSGPVVVGTDGSAAATAAAEAVARLFPGRERLLIAVEEPRPGRARGRRADHRAAARPARQRAGDRRGAGRLRRGS
jgi:nucleotide-binding universal stress UspA family protein